MPEVHEPVLGCSPAGRNHLNGTLCAGCRRARLRVRARRTGRGRRGPHRCGPRSAGLREWGVPDRARLLAPGLLDAFAPEGTDPPAARRPHGVGRVGLMAAVVATAPAHSLRQGRPSGSSHVRVLDPRLIVRLRAGRTGRGERAIGQAPPPSFVCAQGAARAGLSGGRLDPLTVRLSRVLLLRLPCGGFPGGSGRPSRVCCPVPSRQ